MSYNRHDLGDLVRVSATFTDVDAEGPIDPDVVKLSVKKPDDSIETFTYGVGVEIVKDGVGEYHADLDADTSGVWFYRWWSTGDGQGAEEQQFEVLPAQAIDD